MNAGFLHQTRQPVQLTNGPLSYRHAAPSRDGKQIFAVGMKERGELVRYDGKSKQSFLCSPASRPSIPPFPETASGSPTPPTRITPCGAAVTGQAKLTKVAEQAFSYERSLFDTGVRNWPYLRTLPRAIGGVPGHVLSCCVMPRSCRDRSGTTAGV